jgi:hypothetical protein
MIFMREHKVKIKEILAMTVTVEAESAVWARRTAERKRKDGGYDSISNQYRGAVFTAPARREPER